MRLTVVDTAAPLANQTITFGAGLQDRPVTPTGVTWLVKYTNATHPDPVKDARGCYKAGYPVELRPVSSAWGTEEVKTPALGGHFVRITIPDVTRAQVEAFTQSRWGQEVAGPELSGDTLTRRRGVRVRFDLLSPTIQLQLTTTGEVTLPWATVRAAIERIATGQKAG